jgi:hypothetical protein
MGNYLFPNKLPTIINMPPQTNTLTKESMQLPFLNLYSIPSVKFVKRLKYPN